MKYFDFAATTPMSQKALDAFVEAATKCFGNANSLHDEGNKANEVLQFSRHIIGEQMGVESKSVIFTSGGTESNVIALQTLLHNTTKDKKHIIVSSLEHASIQHILQTLQQNEEYEIDFASHHPDGTISLSHVKSLIKATTAMIIVQHVNSEIGVIQEIDLLKELIGNRSIYLHVDCVQSFGKIHTKQISTYADSIAISSHKIYGPKGVGACIFPKIDTLQPFNPNVTHEFSFRSGTVNVPGIYAFSIAAKNACENIDVDLQKSMILREDFIDTLRSQSIEFEEIKAAKHQQLPHIIGLLFPKTQGQYVMIELNKLGYSVSTGSACQVGMQEPPKTLIALGKNSNEAKSYIRISLGKSHNANHCNQLAIDLKRIIKPIQILSTK